MDGFITCRRCGIERIDCACYNYTLLLIPSLRSDDYDTTRWMKIVVPHYYKYYPRGVTLLSRAMESFYDQVRESRSQV